MNALRRVFVMMLVLSVGYASLPAFRDSIKRTSGKTKRAESDAYPGIFGGDLGETGFSVVF